MTTPMVFFAERAFKELEPILGMHSAKNIYDYCLSLDFVLLRLCRYNKLSYIDYVSSYISFKTLVQSLNFYPLENPLMDKLEDLYNKVAFKRSKLIKCWNLNPKYKIKGF